jgi:hypothetical protein
MKLDFLKALCTALLGIVGIEVITLTQIELVVKIICQLCVTLLTCIYLYNKIKNKKS